MLATDEEEVGKDGPVELPSGRGVKGGLGVTLRSKERKSSTVK